MKTKKSDFLIGAPILLALLACGGSSDKVVVESPDEEREVILVPASRPAPVKPAEGTKVKKSTTYPDGTKIETETEVEDD
jgi:hypothetical protein